MLALFRQGNAYSRSTLKTIELPSSLILIQNYKAMPPKTLDPPTTKELSDSGARVEKTLAANRHG